MGLALGIAVVAGVKAADAPFLAGLLVATLAAFALLVPRNISPFIVAAIVGGSLGFVSGTIQRTDTPPPLVAAVPPQITATVVSDPKVSASGYTVRIRWIDGSGHSRESFALIPPAPTLTRGGAVLISGTVEGGHGEFVRANAVRIVADAPRVARLRARIRDGLKSVVTRHVPGSAGTLTVGLLIGDDSALPGDEQQALRRSGLSHITAVSGWNVTMVVGTVGMLFGAFRLRGWGWTALQLVALAGYVWIVGLDPPVTRAAIMGVAALIAIRLGRPSHGATALVLAAATMTLISPAILSSLSFQLSTMATGALIAAGRVSGRWSGWRRAASAPFLTSAFTGIATAPVLAAAFGTLSLATIPANVLAGPLIPLATFLGVALMPAIIFEPLAIGIGTVGWATCSLVLVIARICADIPFAFWEFAPFSPASVALVHLGIIAGFGALTPDGRYVLRQVQAWSRREPGPAFAAGGMLVGVLTVAVVLI